MLKLKLSSVKIGGKKSDKQLSEIENILKFYKRREEVIKCYSKYFKIVNKAAYDAKHGKGLKILTPEQMFQRLPTAVAQVKAGNTSGN